MKEIAPQSAMATLKQLSFHEDALEGEEAQMFDREQINDMLLELGVRPSLRENVGSRFEASILMDR